MWSTRVDGFRFGKPRMDKCARPLAIRQAIGLLARCALCRLIVLLLAERLLQLRKLGFEFLDLLARAQQHAALHIEFLARDQIEITQARLQRAAKGCRHVLARLLEARRNQCGKALRQRVDRLDIDHRSPRSCIETMILARIPVCWKIASFL